MPLSRASHLLRIWFYLSPALFSLDSLRSAGERFPLFGIFVNLNPFTWIFTGYRDALYDGRAPDWLPLGILALANRVVRPDQAYVAGTAVQ